MNIPDLVIQIPNPTDLAKKFGIDYEQMFLSRTRPDAWPRTWPLISEVLDKGYGLYLTNPFALTTPMRIDQLYLSSLSNVGAAQFTACLSVLRCRGVWIGIYIGSAESKLPTGQHPLQAGNETPEEWADRLLLALDPIRKINPSINSLSVDTWLGRYSHDHAHYSIIGGPFGGLRRAADMLLDMGVERIGCEPSPFAHASWLADFDSIFNENFLPRWPDDWHVREDGVYVPLRSIDDAPHIFFFFRTRKTVQEIDEIRSRGWTPIVAIGNIPEELR